MLSQENDGDINPFGSGNGSSVAVIETGKKREFITSNLEKVFCCFELISYCDIHYNYNNNNNNNNYYYFLYPR